MTTEILLHQILDAHKNIKALNENQLYQNLNNLGDRYLFEKNKIYRNIRLALLKYGYTFSSNYSYEYLTLPLTYLNQILVTKIIPYYDNVSALTNIENSNPKLIHWDELVDQIKKNNLFHESCHAIAYSKMNSLYPDKKQIDLFSQQQFLFYKIFEESYANTCELISILDTNDKFHRIFFEINSYICVFDEKSRLQKIEKTLGYHFLFKFSFFCYLYSNYLVNDLSNNNFIKLIELSSDSKEQYNIALNQKKILFGIFKIALDLNPRFRQITTQLYTKINKMTYSHKELISFNFLDFYMSRNDLKAALDQLTHATLK